MTEARIQTLRHDLRSPLTVIVGFAELLAADREMDAATRRDYAERIRNAAAEMRRELDSDV